MEVRNIIVPKLATATGSPGLARIQPLPAPDLTIL